MCRSLNAGMRADGPVRRRKWGLQQLPHVLPTEQGDYVLLQRAQAFNNATDRLLDHPSSSLTPFPERSAPPPLPRRPSATPADCRPSQAMRRNNDWAQHSPAQLDGVFNPRPLAQAFGAAAPAAARRELQTNP